jgi:hypothetical protein
MLADTDDWPIEDIRRTDWLFRQRPRHSGNRHIVVTMRWHVEGDLNVTALLKVSMSVLSSPEQVESDTADLKSWSWGTFEGHHIRWRGCGRNGWMAISTRPRSVGGRELANILALHGPTPTRIARAGAWRQITIRPYD